MKDLNSMIAALKRPKLLTRAARFGLAHYRRDLHLRMALDMATLPRPGQALMMLMEAELEQDMRRRNHDANYAPTRHVSLLIAILGEAELLREAQVSA